MRSRATPVLVGLLGLALVAAACAREAPPGATGPTGPTVTSSPEPSPNPEPTGEPTQEPTQEPSPTPALEDGRHFGYIRSADADAMTLRFDLASFLTGDEANEAAAERGDEVPVPNDYYIVNDNPRLRTLPIDPDVEIRVIDWSHCCELVAGELGPFLDAFATRHHPWDALYQGSQAPYWITVRDGRVTRIEVQYLP
ncbi:hypothetical protein HRbin12_00717 [bacterium HR12]|nr:hypothetical protein HRbin12_00717 [bacterium HR12]